MTTETPFLSLHAPFYVPATPAEWEAVEVAQAVHATAKARIVPGMRVLLPNGGTANAPASVLYSILDDEDDASWASTHSALLDLRHAPTWALLWEQAKALVEREGRWTLEEHPTTGIFGATWAAGWGTGDVVAKSAGSAVGKLFVAVATMDHAAAKARWANAADGVGQAADWKGK